MKICLDAGHQGRYNQSPADHRYYESVMVWKLHLLQKKYLEDYGIEVITTRRRAFLPEVPSRKAVICSCPTIPTRLGPE